MSGARSSIRATWYGPVVVTSRSPTRVVTVSPGSLVKVTTTSLGPTLMSSAFAGPVALVIGSGPGATTDAPGQPPRSPLQPRPARRQPRRAHPFVERVVGFRLDRGGAERTEGDDDRRHLLG